MAEIDADFSAEQPGGLHTKGKIDEELGFISQGCW